ncbi:MAG: ABC transporter ATP-binding protein [Chloroflexi bacterium]|nr:MAG: multidrug ABC transporter ATP-binding protein [Anaerolineaceae bacterium 4572_32.2]RLC81420.1 MAG: ABC transporter ATP-binding protein [Chloroflexota bacterium]RLC87540.1 MAG: ABC transporter ATP-binding protein [Chloroflexota bacterium]HEY72790.1 ABC transporter ATP-binding protein [Thermoflexia bacterium]
MSEYTITVDNLTKRFGDFTAVDHVSFRVKQGEVYGWLGPNGAGKTTTIRMLLGLLKISEGSARVLGYDPSTEAKTMQARVGYMSQLFTLYNDLTARENIRFYGLAYGLPRDELQQRQAEILEMAGLVGRENTLTSNLSGGWKQRLALGCAIVHKPKVVFLDEPTAGVDPISRRDFWGLIYAMAKKGVTVMVTTHYMDEAELCQRVGFISQGRLVALDTPAQLKETQMRGQVLEINTPDPDRAMRVLKQAQASGRLPFDEVALYGAQIHAVVPDAEAFKQPVHALLEDAGVGVQTIEWIAPTLEDVFISAVK